MLLRILRFGQEEDVSLDHFDPIWGEEIAKKKKDWLEFP